MHRELRGPVIDSPGSAALALLLVEDKGGVLLLGDVDVIAGVRGSHDVARARVQQDVLVVFPLYTDQTHAIPARHILAVSIYLVITFKATKTQDFITKNIFGKYTIIRFLAES